MPTWSTTADWDAAQSETGVHHEQPTGTDWAASDTVEKGYPSTGPSATAAGLYWPFDEDSGTTANDVSGNSEDGTITGAGPAATGTVTGPFGNTAYSFDGTDDQVETTTFSIDTWTQLSIMCWYKYSASGGDEGVVTWGEDASWGEVPLKTTNGGGSLRFEPGDGSTTQLVAMTTATNDGNWHLCTATLDEGNQIAIYRDNNATADATTAFGTMGDPSSTMHVGNYVRTGANIAADISDVMVINGVVSGTEHQNAYQAAV